MKKLKKVYLEITNVCNLNCSFCPKTRRKNRFMSIGEFTHLVEQVLPYTDYLNLHVMGEPTLHPNLSQFLEISKECGLKVNITTNGTLLHGSLAQLLLHSEALNKINISLHSFEANETAFTLEEYLNRIISFAKFASQTPKLITALRLWNLNGADTQGKNEMNRQILNRLEQEFTPEEPLEQRLSQYKNAKLANRVFLHLDEKFDWPELERETKTPAVFCYGLRDHFAVLCDGTVVPCCLDHEGDIPLGNLFQQPLAEILDSPRARALYDGFSRRHAVEPLCQGCGYAMRFTK